MAELIVGTSGFVYPHWRGVFYPEGLAEAERLPFYARYFGAVELNVTYYNLPTRENFERWASEVPAGFRFVIKGSRYVTHMKKLKDAEEPVRQLLSRASALGPAFSAVLWQLPANFHRDSMRLGKFCNILAHAEPRVRHAFEFRHESWLTEDVYRILRDHGHALCIAHSTRWPRAEVVTTDFTYLRFHGGAGTYDSRYTDGELREWADKARGWLSSGKDVYAFFNNDAHGYAIDNARSFAHLATAQLVPARD